MTDTLRYMWRRKLRTLLTIFAVSVGIFAVTAVGGMAEFFDAIIQASQLDAYNRITVWPKETGESLTASDIRYLRRIPGVAGVVEQRSGLLVSQEEQAVTILVNPQVFVGVRSDLPELVFEPPLPGIELYAGRLPAPGSRTETLLQWALAEELGLSVGDTLMIQDQPFTVVGIWQDPPMGSDRLAAISYEAAELFPEGVASKRIVAVLPQAGVDPEALAERIETELGEVGADTPAERAREMRQTVLIFSAVTGASGVISLLIGSFTIVNTMAVSVQERRREIGLKKALGAEDRQILGEVVTEAAILALSGGLAGLAGGVAVGAAANRMLMSTMKMQIFRLTPRLAIGVIVFSGGMGVFSGLIPARRAARLNPIAALRGTAMNTATRGLHRLRAFVARNMRALLTVTGIAAGVFALVLLGSLAEALNGYLGAATAGTGDLLVVSPGSDTAFVNRATARAIERMPGVVEVIRNTQESLPVRFGDGVEEEDPEADTVEIEVWAHESESGDLGFAMPVRNSAAAGRLWVPGAVDEVVLGAGLAETHGSEVGDVILINERAFRVVGIWSRVAIDVGGHDNAAFLTMPGLDRALGRPASLGLSVRTASRAAAVDLQTRIAEELPGLNVMSTAEIFGEVRQAFGGLIAAMGAILSIAVFVGAVSVINTMVIAVNEKTDEIGLKKALGAEDGDILAETLMQAGKLGLFGGALGILVAWAGTAVLNPIISKSLGADILHLSPRLALAALLCSLALGTIAGLLPARRAARLDPIAALRLD